MAQETIDHGTLSRLVEAGALRGAHVVGQKGGWALLVQYGTTERPLAAQRSRQVRVWRKLETLVGYLREIGIAKFDVDAVNYDPDQLQATKRPDRAEALRRAHEAVEHDQWFRAEVQAALIEADDPATQWVSHDQAKTDWAKLRAELLGRHA